MFTAMCMDVTPLTHLLSAALCPCIWEDKTRKRKCNSRAVSLPPQGDGSWRSHWLWVSPYFWKALSLLAPLILGDKAKLFLPPEVMQVIALWVFKILFANPSRDYFMGNYSMPFLSPDRWIVAEKPLLRLLLSKGLWQLCAPGYWIVFPGYISLLSNFLMTFRILPHVLMDALTDVWWLHHLPKRTWCPSWFGLNLLRWDGTSRSIEKLLLFLFGLSLEQDWRTWF